MATYHNFQELAENEEEGNDYVVISRCTASPIAIFAPHGGGIEPGTFEFADALAGNLYNFYGFSGIKSDGNWVLHITSTAFDEPLALRMATQVRLAVTIHGCRNQEPVLYLGGRNFKLRQAMLLNLQAAGFPAQAAHTTGFRGMQPQNLCNRCSTGEGLQLELSRGLRRLLFRRLEDRIPARTTEMFDRLVTTLRRVLNRYE